MTSTRLDSEPPQIQPYSGVLSKSLFSVIVKPQPVKPIVEFTSAKHGGVIKSPVPTSLIARLEESNNATGGGWCLATSSTSGSNSSSSSNNNTPSKNFSNNSKQQHYYYNHTHQHRNSDLTKQSCPNHHVGNHLSSSTIGRSINRLNKKKCISINNLLYESTNNNSNNDDTCSYHTVATALASTTTMATAVAATSVGPSTNPVQKNPSSARSVTFLGPTKSQLDAAVAAAELAVSVHDVASASLQQQPQHQPPQARSESLSDNSVDIDDDLDDDQYNYENGDMQQHMVDVIIGGGGGGSTSSSSSSACPTTSCVVKSSGKEQVGLNTNEKQRIAELEDIVKKLSSELGDLKEKLRQEAEKVKISF